MLDIIGDVLQAEEEADRILSAAKQEAARLRNEFAEEETRALRDAQANADRRLRESLAESRAEYDRRVAEAERRIREEAAAFTPERVVGMDQAVSRLVTLVRRGR